MQKKRRYFRKSRCLGSFKRCLIQVFRKVSASHLFCLPSSYLKLCRASFLFCQKVPKKICYCQCLSHTHIRYFRPSSPSVPAHLNLRNYNSALSRRRASRRCAFANRVMIFLDLNVFNVNQLLI